MRQAFPQLLQFHQPHVVTCLPLKPFPTLLAVCMFWVCCIPWVRAENNTAIILNCCQQENMLVSFQTFLSASLFPPLSISLSLSIDFLSAAKCIMQNTFASVDLCYMLGSLSTMQSIRDWPDWRNDGLTCIQWAKRRRGREAERVRGARKQTNNNQAEQHQRWNNLKFSCNCRHAHMP